ncbi:MAG: hypothetical protein OXI16_14000 [Chloroflexota bacterium]|nr:hypothetical protein [Chloroflexota bacterium]
MIEPHNEGQHGSALDKAAHLLGVDKKFVIPGVAIFVICIATIVLLAVSAVADLRSQFFGDPTKLEAAAEVETLVDLPIVIQAGESLPAEEGDGENEVCGEELFGAPGWERGWVWDPDSMVCRRVSGSLNR